MLHSTFKKRLYSIRDFWQHFLTHIICRKVTAMKKKKKIIEAPQYDLANKILFDILDDYANGEGKKILDEYEELERNGQLPEMPPELDAKCRRFIRSYCAKGRRKWIALRIQDILLIVLPWLTLISVLVLIVLLILKALHIIF